MASASTTRVKRFRRKMAESGYARFEASIDAASIDTVRRLAHERNMPIWQALEQAIELLAKDSGSTMACRKATGYMVSYSE